VASQHQPGSQQPTANSQAAVRCTKYWPPFAPWALGPEGGAGIWDGMGVLRGGTTWPLGRLVRWPVAGGPDRHRGWLLCPSPVYSCAINHEPRATRIYVRAHAGHAKITATNIAGLRSGCILCSHPHHIWSGEAEVGLPLLLRLFHFLPSMEITTEVRGELGR
jgi:hypothetical protein